MNEHKSKDQLANNRQGLYVGIVFSVSIIIVVLLVIFKPEAEKKIVRDEPPLVEYIVAKSESISVPIVSQGNVAASQAISLVAEVSGKIDYVSPAKFRAGKFKKGDLLLQIEDLEYQLALARSESNVASAEQKLARVKIEAEQARFDLKQIGRNVSSSTDYALKKPHLIEAQASLKSAKADYELAKLQLQRTKIEAPFDGRVSKKFIDQGQFVASGTVLADVYSIESVEVGLPLSLQQIHLLGVNLGDNSQFNDIKISLSAEYQNASYQWGAEFSYLEHQLDAKSRLIKLVAKIDKPYEQAIQLNVPPLTPGMFVRAVLTGEPKENVFKIPRVALRGADELWLVNHNDQLERRHVRLYGKDAEVVYIESGIKTGERVVVTSIDFPVDKMPLRSKPFIQDNSSRTLNPNE